MAALGRHVLSQRRGREDFRIVASWNGTSEPEDAAWHFADILKTDQNERFLPDLELKVDLWFVHMGPQ